MIQALRKNSSNLFSNIYLDIKVDYMLSEGIYVRAKPK
jgi:hypothetical protein